jgi:hypothetical protein
MERWDWEDQNDAGETKTLLGFRGTGLNDRTLHDDDDSFTVIHFKGHFS